MTKPLDNTDKKDLDFSEHEKKRIRQVRDALNKCRNKNKIEKIAEILDR